MSGWHSPGHGVDPSIQAEPHFSYVLCPCGE